MRLVSDPAVPAQAVIAEAAGILRRGGIVAYPTDTLYGLAVDPRNDAAVGRLFSLKGRDAAAAIALIAADPSQAERAGRFGPVERRLAAAFWPGPLTIVVPARCQAVQRLAPRGTVGVRVPAHAVARALAAALGECITATSANRSGAAAPATAGGRGARLRRWHRPGRSAHRRRTRAGRCAVDHRRGRSSRRPTLHRAGAIAWERVLESVE